MTEADRRIRQIIEAYFGADLDPSVYSSLQPHSVLGGEWLFRQGDPGDSLFFVVRGRLQAWTEGADADTPPRLLGEVLPGDSVGEAGLLTGESRTASVKAIRDSLLIQLDSEDFQRLAERHPAMVMRLASNVATMMQKNLAGSGDARRGYSTITLLALHNTEPVRQTIGQVASRLESLCDARVLNPSRLSELGAPPDAVGLAGELPDVLKQWLADQETDHPMVVYRCLCDGSPWSRYALRQADVVVQVADAESGPERSEKEQAMLLGKERPAGRQLLVLAHSDEQSLSQTANWLAARRIDHHLHLRPGVDDDVERVVRVLSGRAVGLVLGAGAVRGLAALGVYKALREKGVTIDWVGGSSIGAIVGAAVARDWTAEHAIDVTRDAFVKGKPFSDYTVPVVSLVRGQRMMRLLKDLVDIPIEDLPIPYFCVSSILGRGELSVHERGSLVDAVRASAALPGVLPPAVVDSELAVDGAVLNNLPVDVMLARPVNRIIAVDCSSNAPRTVDFEETPSSWAVLRGKWLPFARRLRVPDLATVILRSTEIGTLSQSRRRGELAELLIAPPVRQFGMTDVEAFDRIVEAGYQEAIKALERWRD